MVHDVEDEEQGEHDEFMLTKTGFPCAECSESIHLGEEIFQVRVVHAQRVGEEVTYYDVLNEYGDAEHDARFFDFQCWEGLEEELIEMAEDTPPMTDANGMMECDICGSDIREFDVFALVQFGEIHSALRSPNGRHAMKFANMGKDKQICIACVYNAEERLWEEEIEPVHGVPVCNEGIYARCWRSGCNSTVCDKQIEE